MCRPRVFPGVPGPHLRGASSPAVVLARPPSRAGWRRVRLRVPRRSPGLGRASLAPSAARSVGVASTPTPSSFLRGSGGRRSLPPSMLRVPLALGAVSRVFFFGRAVWLFRFFSLCAGGPLVLRDRGCEAPLALQLVVVLLLSLCHCVVGPTCAVAFLGPSSRDARRGRHSPRLRAPTLSTTSLHTEAPAMTANN